MTWNCRHAFATSPRHAPELLHKSLAQRGRGECRMPNAPAASCALLLVERTRVTTSTPESPGIPARNGFNGFRSAQRGRGECRMPNAPAASCALLLVERTRVTTSTPESPGIPARNGFNGFLRALPGDRAVLPPSSSGYVFV